MLKLSVCIPAYNRYEFMGPLLDSVLSQDYPGLEIVICEDLSPERELIREVVMVTKDRFGLDESKLRYYENSSNLGYDRNLRRLLEVSTGDYCLFMGNDDLLAPHAIERIVGALETNPTVAVISRAYQWFVGDPDKVQETVRHLPEDKLFPPGPEAIRFFFRRVGVLSGLVFERLPALQVSTDLFDGHLYYQMYLAGTLLKSRDGYYISDVQTLSRDGINPDFGNSDTERNAFVPGSYSYEGRVHMVEGLLKIADYIDDTPERSVYSSIKQDIGIYFYPYIRDQLSLPMGYYIDMVRRFRAIGMRGDIFFHLHCLLGYVLKKRGYDYSIKIVRRLLGHSPMIGI